MPQGPILIIQALILNQGSKVSEAEASFPSPLTRALPDGKDPKHHSWNISQDLQGHRSFIGFSMHELRFRIGLGFTILGGYSGVEACRIWGFYC